MNISLPFSPDEVLIIEAWAKAEDQSVPALLRSHILRGVAERLAPPKDEAAVSVDLYPSPSNPAFQQAILAELKASKTDAEIALQFKTSSTVVARTRKKLGINYGTKPSRQERQELANAIAA